MSLIPEKPLTLSPSLAATIGLEEALLLGILGEFIDYGITEQHNNFNWLEVSAAQLHKAAPFWNERDIQRICNNLRSQGILLIASAPFSECGQLRFAINESSTAQSPAAPQPAAAPAVRGANHIAHNWQPDDELLRQLAQYSIPQTFALQQVPEFVTYWSERGEPQHSWGSKFIKQVLRAWRDEQTRENRNNREAAMAPQWRPSQDAMDILTQQAGISEHFIEDAIPEFVLYWCERGERSSTWNSRFILHIKKQWARFTAVIKNDAEPRPISGDWQPDDTVYDVLALANIDRQFAERQVAEFVLYWKDTGRVESSWNTRFLQNVKRQWARHNALPEPSTASDRNERQQRPYRASGSRGRSAVQQLTDRSWAS
ncbi:DnaT-like ssDNA-binding domain-containing protein [Porticoccus sp. W117]|uniref:DnaT-like ssDNA-binding domain-containing protein n=1 Tax=Porticoccus sp. W117 TaxID=3054777 RepID=UPI002599D65E|nr:DnaT-like ssDNA-binding domain-containing protein [Porticoccus sp. W117]MDM3871909.1 DnaT-like ssDNA-binding domain-containing protein [Porticoccus sp. W117]